METFLVVLLLVAIIGAVMFVMTRRRQRSGGVLASKPRTPRPPSDGDAR